MLFYSLKKSLKMKQPQRGIKMPGKGKLSLGQHSELLDCCYCFFFFFNENVQHQACFPFPYNLNIITYSNTHPSLSFSCYFLSPFRIVRIWIRNLQDLKCVFDIRSTYWYLCWDRSRENGDFFLVPRNRFIWANSVEGEEIGGSYMVAKN